MADPVAWTMIERGWKVRDAAGDEVGKVGRVGGDPGADIFDGLTITRGVLSKDRYVRAEAVAEIVEGTVKLSLSRAEVESLPEFHHPAAEERVLPESSTWYQRLAWWLTGRNR
ncbi:MAG TPA: hypothetical protein VE088_01275 [Gaiellaceae bacterium]|jgi:hypothetical protein|nr:hypothetical protein [Gaiellaceae bacterium]